MDVALTGRPLRIERHHAGLDLELVAFCVEDERVACIVRDLTSRTRAEGERELGLRRGLQAQKLESLGRLAGGMAYDFSDLLSGVAGGVDLILADSQLDDGHRAAARLVREAALRGGELCEQLYAYSGRARCSAEPLNLAELIHSMADLLGKSVPRRIELKLDLGRALPDVTGDSAQLVQVVLSLVLNAAEALPGRGGEIQVRTGVRQVGTDQPSPGCPPLAPGSYVFLDVVDNGCGMDEATRAQVFDPYFTTKRGGRGLGLAAALGIVRSHHGCIHIDSEPGRGTTFRVLLPASTGRNPASRPPRSATMGWTGNGLVLLIGDEPLGRNLTQRLLERLGFRVVSAGGGAAGLELFARHQPDVALVLLDLATPAEDAHEVLAEIRRQSGLVKALLVSGRRAPASPELEPIGWLQKPFGLARLRQALQELLGGTE